MVTWGVTDPADESASTVAGGVSDGDIPAAIRAQLGQCTETTDRPIPRRTDGSFAGETARLVLPGSETTVTSLSFDAQYQLTTASELPDGGFLVTTTVRTAGGDTTDPLTGRACRVFVRFEGPASLRPTDDGVVLSLWDRKPVTVGYREIARATPGRITVPDSPAGIAAGVSALSVAHHTIAPSRSHPGLRDHPPLLTVGESLSVPDSVQSDRTETGIELRLPADLPSVFVAAPLAYYLGAEMSVADRNKPVLTTADGAVHHEFDPLPAFQQDVAALLRHVFYLDCLVRRVDPNRANVNLLADIDIDPATVQELSPAGRLDRYLDIPAGRVAESLPDWHLSTYARPSAERVRCLPFLLDKLSLIYLPDGTELDRSDLLERTLSDAYPTRGTRADRSSVLAPNLQAGRIHAWLAPGTPIDAHKTIPAAYENRYRFRDRDNDRLQVAVVLNDREMGDEHSAVAEIYRERADSLPMDVTVHEQLPTDCLGSVFEANNDFVHYIGHCDEDGLRCPDGSFSACELTEVRTPTFFLNACGSYDEGLDFVRRGAVAGAVTFTDVLDKHAATVGTAFARLLVHGFSIDRALQLARRRIVMGKDYAVVGDGTYAILPSPGEPAVLWLADGDDGYNLTYDVVSPRRAGERYQLPFDGGTEAINGRTREYTVTASELVDVLEQRSLPVIYGGEFHWSEELADTLRQ
ncbi:hypothetical protein [Haloarcula halophila]|uniref:hypothetical protein n=1 Tax=Haloarcula TaxID=2237 RepID=UPI0023E35966|nr:hypothetical protein [Halomicroarcula sp. DFY41]